MNVKVNEGIFDARQLGVPKMIILGVQHTFAMFGATVLVPLLTGLNVSTTLLCAGLGTLLFHLITKGKVPAFWVRPSPSWAVLPSWRPWPPTAPPTPRCCPTPAAALCSRVLSIW